MPVPRMPVPVMPVPRIREHSITPGVPCPFQLSYIMHRNKEPVLSCPCES